MILFIPLDNQTMKFPNYIQDQCQDANQGLRGQMKAQTDALDTEFPGSYGFGS